MIKIIFFGDVVGKIGRQGLKKILPILKKRYQPNLTIANGENLAHGTGVTKKILAEMKKIGIDFLTSGNHIFENKEIEEIFIDQQWKDFIIRPANQLIEIGDGAKLLKVGKFSILVINLLGRVFIDPNLDCPFKKLDEILVQYKKEKINAILVDIHAEATSEKVALGWYADGRVSAILGTHTHVGTVDAKILPQGTAYITDIGMVGAKDSVIGVKKEGPIAVFLEQESQPFEPPENGQVIINAVYLEIDPQTKKTKKIKRIDLETTV
ncbi:MAG: TIGR00282 family metallophosphoesterase [Patescibacteria group bacterium]